MKKIIQKVNFLQEKALEIRRNLFYDPILGYNHNMGGVRTGKAARI